MQGDSHGEEKGHWKSIWRWKGPQWIRTFLWLVVKNKLLTRQELARRYIIRDPTCQRCNLQVEYEIHVLRDCVFAKQIWLNLVPVEHRKWFFRLDLKDWITKNLANECQFKGENQREVVFAVGVWRLWFWRNRAQMINRAQEISVGTELQGEMKKKNEDKQQMIQWRKPASQYFKLNTDGACDPITG